MNGNNFPGMHITKTISSLLSATLIVLIGSAQLSAAPTYKANKVLVAEDQYQGEKGLDPNPIYKPHEVVVSQQPNIWISSNERTGFAGITIFG